MSRPEFEGSGLTVAANRGGDFRGAADAGRAGRADAGRAGRRPGPGLVSGYHPDLDRHGHLAGVDSRAVAGRRRARWTRCSPGWSTACRRTRRCWSPPTTGSSTCPPSTASTSTPTRGCAAGVRRGGRRAAGALPAHRAGRDRRRASPPGRRCSATPPGCATREEAVAGGWFGPVPPEHLGRIGDVVVVCHGTYAVLATGDGAGRWRRGWSPYHGSVHRGRDDRPAADRPRGLTGRRSGPPVRLTLSGIAGRASLRAWDAASRCRGGGDPRFGPDADDAGCTDPARRHGRLLRRGRGAPPARAARPAGRGRRRSGPRGVVSSASYEARRYGVRSAMPTMRARALCPHAVFLPPDFAAYSAASRAVMEIFRDVTPLVEPLSLDEAFLDVAGARRLLGRPAEIARPIRARVAERAAADLLGRGGADQVRRQARLHPGQAGRPARRARPARSLEFLHPLPVDALWGVGERAAETLRRLGLTTVGDLAEAPRRHAARGARRGGRRAPARAGLGARPAPGQPRAGGEVDRRRDDLRHRRGRPGGDPPGAAGARREGRRAAARGPARWAARSSIKVRLADFRTVNRSRTLRRAHRRGTGDLRHRRGRCSRRCDAGDRIRLVGVRVEGLAAAAERATAAHPGRAGARLAGGGGGGGRRGCPIRAFRRRSGQSSGTSR